MNQKILFSLWVYLLVIFLLSDIWLFDAFIRDIYFIGGFGTVQWIDVNDYEDIQPDKIAADGGEQNLKVSENEWEWCLIFFSSSSS